MNIKELFRIPCNFPNKRNEDLRLLGLIAEHNLLTPLSVEDSDSDIILLIIHYKGKGKYRTFAGFSVWKCVVGTIKQRVNIFFRSFVLASPNAEGYNFQSKIKKRDIDSIFKVDIKEVVRLLNIDKEKQL